MATRTWNSTGSTDLNDSSNYSGTGALLTTDDLVFTSASVVNATATDSLDVGSVTIASNYTGVWSISGYTLTTNNNTGFSDSGITGAHNYGNGITNKGGSSAFTISSSGSVITATSCALQFDGTTSCTLTDNRGITFKSLTLGASAIFTSNGSATSDIQGATTLLTMGASSQFTMTRRITFTPTANMTLFSLGAGYAWSSTVGSIISTAGAGTLTITIPATTVTGSGNWTFSQNSQNAIYNLAGDLVLGNSSSYLTIGSGSASFSVTFNAVTYSVTSGILNTGSTSSASTTINYGSGTWSFTTVDFSARNGATSSDNFQTSQWVVLGNWTFGSNHTIDAGTSLVTFSGTGASAVTSSGKSFYDVTVNNASKAFSFVDAASLHTLIVTAATSYTHTGTTLSASGDISYNLTGTINLGTALTLTGATTTLTLATSITSVTATSCVLTLSNTGIILSASKTLIIKQLVISASATVTNSSSATIRATNAGIPFILGASATFTNNGMFGIYTSTANDLFTQGASSTWNGTGTLDIQIVAAVSVTIPTWTYSGSGRIDIYNAAAGTSTITFTGATVLATSQILIYATTATMIINFNNQNFTSTGNLALGSTGGSAFTANLGSGTFSLANWNNTALDLGTTKTTNFDTANITFTGNATFSANHTYVATGACSITFTGASSIFTIAGSTATMTGCALAFNGTTACQLNDNKGVIFKSLTLGASAVLTTAGSATISFRSATPLTFTNSGTLTMNSTCNYQVDTTGGSFTNITGTPTINGTAAYNFNPWFLTTGTAYLPAWTYTGTGGCSIIPGNTAANANSVVTLTGALNTSSTALNISVSNSTLLSTFNTANYNITCNEFRYGTVGGVGALQTVNLGSSTLSCTIWNGGSSNVAGTINLGSATITCSGNWTFGSTHTVDAGTSLVTITGASTITSNTKAFYDLTISTGVVTVTVADNLTLHNLVLSSIVGSTITMTSRNITSSGNVSYSSAGTVNNPGNLTMNGNSTTFLVDAGTHNSAQTFLTWNGTGGTWTVNVTYLSIRAITLGTNANLTQGGGGNIGIYTTSTINSIYFGVGSSFTTNRQITFNIYTSNNVFASAGAYTFNGTGGAVIRLFSGTALNVGPITYTGTGTFELVEAGISGTISLLGDISTTAQFYCRSVNAGKDIIFNTNNYNITCTDLRLGSSNTGLFTANLGSSNIICTSYSSSYNSLTSVQTINMQTSTWVCSGSWEFANNHTISAGTSLVSFVNTGSIRCNTKRFYGVKILSGLTTVTLSDDLYCDLLTIATGTFNRNGKSVIASRDDIFIDEDIFNCDF